MFIYMSIYIYININNIYIYIYIYLFSFYVYIYLFIFLFFIYIYICIFLNLYIYFYSYINIYIYICMITTAAIFVRVWNWGIQEAIWIRKMILNPWNSASSQFSDKPMFAFVVEKLHLLTDMLMGYHDTWWDLIQYFRSIVMGCRGRCAKMFAYLVWNSRESVLRVSDGKFWGKEQNQNCPTSSISQHLWYLRFGVFCIMLESCCTFEFMQLPPLLANKQW